MAPRQGLMAACFALGVALASGAAWAQGAGPAPDAPVRGAVDDPASQPASAPASGPASDASQPARRQAVDEPATPPPRPAPPDLRDLPRGLCLGIYGLGYFPVGSWINHPYAGVIAPGDLDYFGPGGGGAFEILGRYRRLNFLARGEVGGLSSSAWERWTAQHGGAVTVRTLAWGVHWGLGYVVGHLGRTRLETDFLIGVIGFKGRETDPRYGVTYALDFLHTAASFRVRLAAAFAVVRSLELYGAFEAGLAAPTISAAEGNGPTTTLSLALGVRLWPIRPKGKR